MTITKTEARERSGKEERRPADRAGRAAIVAGSGREPRVAVVQAARVRRRSAAEVERQNRDRASWRRRAKSSSVGNVGLALSDARVAEPRSQLPPGHKAAGTRTAASGVDPDEQRGHAGRPLVVATSFRIAVA